VKSGEVGQLRVKLGDTVEGFKVSEIHENRVVLSKGASKVEIAVDYFRRVEEPRDRVRAPSRALPRVPARTPRRETIDQPPSSEGTE
jgi:hypothetical protein